MKRVIVRLGIDERRRDIDVLVTAPSKDEQVDSLISRIEDPLAGTIAVLDDEGKSVLLNEDLITSISTDNKRLRIMAEEGSYHLRSSLRDVEGLLNPNSFLRISRYEIINLRKVSRFDFSIQGTLRIEMKNGSEAWASRRYIRTIKDRLQERGKMA